MSGLWWASLLIEMWISRAVVIQRFKSTRFSSSSISPEWTLCYHLVFRIHSTQVEYEWNSRSIHRHFFFSDHQVDGILVLRPRVTVVSRGDYTWGLKYSAMLQFLRPTDFTVLTIRGWVLPTGAARGSLFYLSWLLTPIDEEWEEARDTQVGLFVTQFVAHQTQRMWIRNGSSWQTLYK